MSGVRSAAELVNKLRIGRATVFEAIRLLRAAGAIDDLPEARYRLAKKTPLGRALRELVAALATGVNKKGQPPTETTSKEGINGEKRRESASFENDAPTSLKRQHRGALPSA